MFLTYITYIILHYFLSQKSSTGVLGNSSNVDIFVGMGLPFRFDETGRLLACASSQMTPKRSSTVAK